MIQATWDENEELVLNRKRPVSGENLTGDLWNRWHAGIGNIPRGLCGSAECDRRRDTQKDRRQKEDLLPRLLPAAIFPRMSGERND